MSVFTLAIPCLTTSNLPWFMDLTFQVPMQYCSYSIGLYFHHLSHAQLSVVFALAPSLRSVLELFIHWSTVAFWLLLTWGVHLSVSCLFAFSYCSWGSQDKNIVMVCHSLLQWTTVCQNSPPWPIHLGWPYTACLIVSLSLTRLWSMWSHWLVFCDCGFQSVIHIYAFFFIFFPFMVYPRRLSIVPCAKQWDFAVYWFFNKSFRISRAFCTTQLIIWFLFFGTVMVGWRSAFSQP